MGEKPHLWIKPEIIIGKSIYVWLELWIMQNERKMWMEMNKIAEYEEKVKSSSPRIIASCQHVLALMIHYPFLSHNFPSCSSSFELRQKKVIQEYVDNWRVS